MFPPRSCPRSCHRCSCSCLGSVRKIDSREGAPSSVCHGLPWTLSSAAIRPLCIRPSACSPCSSVPRHNPALAHALSAVRLSCYPLAFPKFFALSASRASPQIRSLASPNNTPPSVLPRLYVFRLPCRPSFLLRLPLWGDTRHMACAADHCRDAFTPHDIRLSIQCYALATLRWSCFPVLRCSIHKSLGVHVSSTDMTVWTRPSSFFPPSFQRSSRLLRCPPCQERGSRGSYR